MEGARLGAKTGREGIMLAESRTSSYRNGLDTNDIDNPNKKKALRDAKLILEVCVSVNDDVSVSLGTVPAPFLRPYL